MGEVELAAILHDEWRRVRMESGLPDSGTWGNIPEPYRTAWIEVAKKAIRLTGYYDDSRLNWSTCPYVNRSNGRQCRKLLGHEGEC